jgi:hypothetical protein
MIAKERTMSPTDLLARMEAAIDRAVGLCLAPVGDRDDDTTERRICTFAPSYPQQLDQLRREREH